MRKIVVFAAVAFALGCGSNPRPKTPESEPESQTGETGLMMQHELGVLDEEKVRTTFEENWRGPMRDCQKEGGEMISGATLIRMRVNHSGGVKWVYFKETNLGDRAVEKCMLDALRKTKWPIPEGGEDGMAEQELTFADYADRGPEPWDTDKVREAISENTSDISACRNGITGSFIATAIVDKDGTVASVGIQQPDETADEAADCMAKVIREMQLPKTGSWPAKVSFQLP